MYSLKVYYQNCQGLNTKLGEFYRNTSEKQFDIIVVVETWLAENVIDGEVIDLNEYNLFRSDTILI